LTTNFDVNYIYKINTNAGWSCSSTGVTAANIYFYNGAHINVAATNRRAVSNGWVVTKIMKRSV
jgi:hypothetical protein